MGPDLLDSGSLVTVISKELQDKVLEVSAKVSLIGLLEILISLVSVEQVVEVFISLGLLEGENATYYNPSYHSDREHVYLLSTVSLTLLDLRCHIRHGASVRTKCIDVLVSGKSKVCNLQVKVIID